MVILWRGGHGGGSFGEVGGMREGLFFIVVQRVEGCGSVVTYCFCCVVV